jgi:hypothetical protein
LLVPVPKSFPISNVPPGTKIISITIHAAEITPEFAVFVAAAPATVKKFAGTPCKVNPALGVSVIVAVYAVEAANVPVTAGDHATVPVYWAVSVIADTGVPPVAGGVIPAIAAMLMVVAGIIGVTESSGLLPVPFFSAAFCLSVSRSGPSKQVASNVMVLIVTANVTIQFLRIMDILLILLTTNHTNEEEFYHE